MPPNVVITVARKPLDPSAGTLAKNAMKHGTGGINIDGSRVGSEGATAKGSRPEGLGHGIYGAGLHGSCEIVSLQAGRWPANMILVHLEGCRCVGVKKVSGTGIAHRGNHLVESVVYGSGIGGAGLNSLPNSTYADEDGLDWDCQPGCPVAALDEQSGIGSSPAPYVQKTAKHGEATLFAAMVAAPREGQMSNHHGGTGGASRFFKQIRPPSV